MSKESKESKFLPDSVSGALRKFALRAAGFGIFIFGIIFSISLLFGNPYLDGFAASSGFGNQSFIYLIVNFVRFGIGFIPSLFLFLCIARTGISILMNWEEERIPEYNAIRIFLTICFGACGFGAILPSASFGGMAGNIVASDINSFAGGWTFVFGIVFLGLFFLMAGIILHIKWSDVMAVFRALNKFIKKLLSAFHLIKPAVPALTDENIENEIEEDYEEDDDKSGTKTVVAKKENPIKIKSIFKKKNTSGYQLPDPELLEKSSLGKNVVTPEMKRNASALESHFEEFGVYGKVVGIKPGPIVTSYEFEPESGVRISKVTDTVKDMTRAMATENIRIAHIPRTNYIGVEMVNINRQTVRMQGLITNPAFADSKYKIPLALGVDIGGNPMYFDLAKMPHVLIAGRTGSGKSVFMQSIIMSMMYHFTPDKCKLLIVDPKAVDFTLWDRIPHLITPVVTDSNSAVNALKWSVRDMEDRYKKLKELGVQNIEGYNEAVSKLRETGKKLTRQVAVGTDPETGELEFETQELDLSDMPYMVIMIDEVADLMSVARKDVEACVQRLAQKARAAGIHIVAATQRPDTTVITGVIKANFPTRISFQARSSIDSGTTLGEKGAEQLLAFGDMLFSEAGRVPVRIHGSWIENTEINKVADFLRGQGEPEYMDGVSDGDSGSVSGYAEAPIPGMPVSKDSKDADLYEQAKQYVIRDKKPTISYIQRRLGVGYNKAAGFMERMEAEGIVSGPDANNKRQIL